MARLSAGFTNLIHSTGETLNKVVSKAPSTNWKVFLALICSVVTVILYWVTVLVGKEPSDVTFGLLLAFLTTWLFDGRKQFEVKRKTEWNTNGHTVPYELQAQSMQRRDTGKDDGTEPI